MKYSQTTKFGLDKYFLICPNSAAAAAAAPLMQEVNVHRITAYKKPCRPRPGTHSLNPTAQHAASQDWCSWSCGPAAGGSGPCGGGHGERLPHHVGPGASGAERHAGGDRWRGHHQPLGVLGTHGDVPAPVEPHWPIHELYGA